MVDLQKEFKTLKLLSWALLIIGGGLAIGGFGIALMTRDAAKKTTFVKPASSRMDIEAEETPPPVEVPLKRDEVQKLTSYTSQITFNTGLMGLLFIGLGWTLKWIIRNNIDDDDSGEVQMSDELFKTYAEQVMLAEKLKQKNRKKIRLDL